MKKLTDKPAKVLSRTRTIDVEVTEIKTIQLNCQEGCEKFLHLIRTFSLPKSYKGCSHCDQPILWVELFTGKRAPLEIEQLDDQFNISFHQCPNYPGSI